MSTAQIYLIHFIAYFSICNAYKILVVFPYPARSHGYLGDGVVRNLLKEGHEVTYISPYVYKPASQRLRMIDVSSNAKLLPDNMYDFKTIINQKQKVEVKPLISYLIDMMKHTIQNDDVQKLLNDPQEQFDAVIIEWFFTELLAGFAVTYNCPTIWVSGLDTHWLILRLIDQPSNPTYSTDFLSSNVPPFTFWERVTELYTQFEMLYWKYMYTNEWERQEYESMFAPIVATRGRLLPSYYDVQFNASLVLSNSHTSMGNILTIPQNYIRVGGYHIKEELEPLSEVNSNLKSVMDKATNGVIYFSMGSNLKSKDLPKEIRSSILKMFSELKQTVLWKFEEDLERIPHNVHVIKWAPQHSILAHPNTKLFITHGGLLSTTEAIHFGVPIIGIPAFGDQFMNIAKSVLRGFAKKVDLSYNVAEELKSAIEEVINNPRFGYTKKAKELSFVYHDRPVPPGKELLHWIRHVIETGGAPHLRSPALQVPFYQKLYLDLLALVVVYIFAIVTLFICLCYVLKKKYMYIRTATQHCNDKTYVRQIIKKKL